MNLQEQVKQKRIETLYKKYPKHKEWFEDVLVKELAEKGVYSTIAYMVGLLRKDWNKHLPVYDDNGPVELEEIQELLRLEGLSANIYSGGEAGYFELVIKVKEE